MGWPDKFTKKAHKEGYSARSVYKLQDIDAKFSILHKGFSVLDLGCYPGSFSQYASEKVGKDGKVIGVDTQRVTRKPGMNAETFVADVMDDSVERILKMHSPFDVVFSDMAPQTTGVRVMDQNRSADLAERAWDLAVQFGRPGTKVVIKYFQGAGAQKLLARLKKEKVKAKTYKPEASREESYEMFLIAEVS